MRMSEGVEWGLHCCVALGWIGQDEVVSTARLAAKFGLPAAYLNKSLQALARAGILASSAGPKGGFRLARPPARITLLEVVDAIEGQEAAFRCSEIRRNGEGAAPPAECRRPCAIASAMRGAEAAWRKELSRQTIAMVMDKAPRSAAERTVRWHAFA
ncbi:Rrf2 family transcriptional regulator [Pigmentiphaga sp. H8]|uniref:RrF2 family transcriptional regulator n=1 Tax=unclassified Pigmentiphaga TaxID=2626614 RepID=UPI000F5A9CA1|nr:Rrf2 family transcriptional regulator [Pigmentiphaga sp. H8]AZG06878.1 Rrf2 family transcriptional regulator [Pigmentiphaga sp. H8]